MVRHGESEWNALGRWQGQADVPLSDLGRRQAFAASAALGTVDVIAASTLERAYVTASILSEHLGVGPILVDPDLQERHAGPWQGSTRAEIERDWPGYLADGRRPEGYELDSDLVMRALAALDRVIAETDATTLLIVSHGGVICALEQHLGLPFTRLPNLAGRWFTCPEDQSATTGLDLGPRVLLVEGEGVTAPTVE
jgi:broad specificity phosphatase PhoE